MSRNNKNARNVARRKAITALHLKGEKGPARTTPLHSKRMGYRTNPVAMKALAEFVRDLNGEDSKEKTSGKRILRKAGGATSPTEGDE